MKLLAGAKILDLGGNIAGAYAARVLADLGAHVEYLEVDGYRNGDIPPALDDYLRHGKRKVTGLDKLTDAAQLERSLASFDIVICDGSDVEIRTALIDAVKLRDTGIVICSVSPWGLSDTSRSNICSDELFFFARSGIASVTPEGAENSDSERPTQLWGNQAQFVAGLTAAVASVQALLGRSSGEGVLIDLSILGALLAVPITSYAAVQGGRTLGPQPNAKRRGDSVPREFWRCRDGYIYTQGGDDNWAAWASVLGKSEWRSAPFTDPEYRRSNWPSIAEAIDRWLVQRSKLEVATACQEAGIVVFAVNTIGDFLQDEQTQSRTILETLQSSSGQLISAPRTPVRVAE